MLSKGAGLPIAHLNTRGLINKIDELKLHIAKLKLKILHISESFLSPNIKSTPLNIPNFNISRRDRENRHGGVALTYIHSSLNYSVITKLDSILPELLTLKFLPHSAIPFISSVVYRPPDFPASWID